MAHLIFNSFLNAPDQPVAMPLLFLGHGSPMNAIEDNPFVRGFQNTASLLPTPRAILCISAHWETRGTAVTAMEHPKTIHDFGGFPEALFQVQYPAPGSPELAKATRATVTSAPVQLTEQWGLDHGAWSVIKHLYPAAQIPVIQLSLDRTQSPAYHYQLGTELSTLRKKGVLIIGSGNLVHNLGMMDWQRPDSGFEWAIEANSQMREEILNHRHDSLIDYNKAGLEMHYSIPTPEHYLPLLYVLGASKQNESVRIFNDRTIYGSIGMMSVQFGGS